MKRKIERAAGEFGRSQSQELEYRLELSFRDDVVAARLRSLEYVIRELIKRAFPNNPLFDYETMAAEFVEYLRPRSAPPGKRRATKLKKGIGFARLDKATAALIKQSHHAKSSSDTPSTR